MNPLPTTPAPAGGPLASPETPSLPAVKAGSDGYHPGAIRRAADAAADAVALFVADHPEYGGLSPFVVQQAMSSRTRQADRAAELRHDEGIPDDWRERREDGGTSPRLAEEG